MTGDEFEELVAAVDEMLRDGFLLGGPHTRGNAEFIVKQLVHRFGLAPTDLPKETPVTPADHYAEAERLLADFEESGTDATASMVSQRITADEYRSLVDHAAHMLTKAQVHATLATCVDESGWNVLPEPTE